MLAAPSSVWLEEIDEDQPTQGGYAGFSLSPFDFFGVVLEFRHNTAAGLCAQLIVS